MKSFRKLRLRKQQKSRKVGGRKKDVEHRLRTRTPFTSGEEPPTPEEVAAAAAAAGAAAAAAAADARAAALADYKVSRNRGIELSEYILSNIDPAQSLTNPSYNTLVERLFFINNDMIEARAGDNLYEQQNPGIGFNVSKRKPVADMYLSELKELAKKLHVSLPAEEPLEKESLDGGRYYKRKKRRTLRRKSRHLRH